MVQLNSNGVGTSYTASHNLGDACGERVRWLPISPAGPADLDGRTICHKPLAIGLWDAVLESHLLAIIDVEVTCRDGRTEGVDFSPVVMWEHCGACTDLQVAEGGAGDDVLLVTGSSRGHVTLTRMIVPRMPGTLPQDMTLLGNTEGSRLEPWATPHKGAVASVDVHPDTKAILTAGADGGLSILSADSIPGSSGSGGGAAPFKQGTGHVSYSNARWTDRHTFVTSSSSSCGVELWDVRQGPRPIAKHAAPKGSTSSGGELHWLHVHPSRPNECAGGTGDGGVSVWDLRHVSSSVACLPGGSVDGPVWEVRFDPKASSMSEAAPTTSVSPILFSCEGGVLGRTLVPGGTKGAAFSTICRSHCAVNSFDVEASRGDDVVCVTDSHDLLYLSQA